MCRTPDFRRRFLALLSYQFSTFSPPLALNIIQNKNIEKPAQPGKQRVGMDGCLWQILVGFVAGGGEGSRWSRKKAVLGIEGQVLGISH